MFVSGCKFFYEGYENVYFVDEFVFVNWLFFFFVSKMWCFGLYFFYVFENYVVVVIEGFDVGEEFVVVVDGDEDLVVGLDSGVEDVEGIGGEFMFFKLSNFVFFVFVLVLIVGGCEGKDECEFGV